MTVHIALLRAVNLPSHKKVSMGDLRAMATDLGLDETQTLLQSGNLVFSSAASPAKLETMLEAEARKRLKLDTEFMVRTAKQWNALIDSNPFTKEAKADPSHLVVMVCKKAVGKPKVTGARREIVKPKGKEIYIYYPDGIGRSRLKIDAVGTGRNWNTVLKLDALAKG
jgi:uncharacterized protein (DUF1697 family)